MNKKLYIGISGKMGTGKSTLTKHIMEAFQQLAVGKVSLAGPIYGLQKIIYDKVNIEMEGEKDRDLLIALGMWGRNKDGNFWLDQAVKEMEENEFPIVICDDVRFENEAEWFKEHGVLMRLEGVQRGPNVDHNVNNKTETALDEFDFPYYIDNKISEELTTMSALHAIAQHLDVSKQLMDNIAKELTKEA